MATATEPTIEQRLLALEAAVAELRRQPPPGPASALGWFERVSGIMKDQPGFQEMVAYGRAFREAEGPPGEEVG